MNIFNDGTFQEEEILEFEDVDGILNESENLIHKTIMAFDHQMAEDE